MHGWKDRWMEHKKTQTPLHIIHVTIFTKLVIPNFARCKKTQTDFDKSNITVTTLTSNLVSDTKKQSNTTSR